MLAIRSALLVLAVLLPCGPLSAQQKDAYGDPLPEGAKVRIGTTRMHKPGGGAEWHGAALTPDGKFLLSPIAAGAIERIDIATGRPVGTIGEKDGTRNGRDRIVLSADGKRGMSLGNSTISVWDAQTGRELTRVETGIEWSLPTAPSAASLSADGTTLAFGINGSPMEGKKLTAAVWTVGEAKRRLTVEVVQDRSVAVSLSPDGKVLATWGKSVRRPSPMQGPPDSPIQFWDATSGKALGEFTVKQAWVTAVVFTPDGKSAAVIDGKGTVLLIDPTTGRESKRFGVRGEMGSRVYFSPGGKTLAVAWADGTVHLWDIATDKELSVTKCPAQIGGSGASLVFTGEKQAVAWAIEGSKAVVWEAPSGKVLSPVGGHSVAPNSLAFTVDGKELLTGGSDWTTWTALRWDPASGKPLGTVVFEVPKGINLPPYRSVTLFPGAAKAVAHAGAVQYVYDPRTGKRLHDLTLINRDVAPHLCADGELYIIPTITSQPATRPWMAAVRELATDKKLCEIELPAGVLHGQAIRTPDGKKLLTPIYSPIAGSDRVDFVVTLWDLATGKKLGEITETDISAGWVGLAPSPDGTKAYVTDAKKGLRLLDFTTGKVLYTFNTAGLTPCAGPLLSPNGKWFAVGLCDPDNPTRDAFEVRIYDAESGKSLKTFRGHKGLVSSLAFSPDGKTLASASYDTTILLWDLSTLPGPK